MLRLYPDNCPSDALSCIIAITRSAQFVAFLSCCQFHQAMRDGGTPDAAVWATMHANMNLAQQTREVVAREYGLTKAGGAPSASRVPLVSRAYLRMNSVAPADFPLPPAPYVRADVDSGYTVVSGRTAIATTALQTAVVAHIAADPIARNAPTALLRVVR